MNVEHYFICFFFICISSLVRYLLRCLAHFLIKLFFYCRMLRVFWYILDNSSLSDVSFVNIFSQSMASLIILLILSFAEHNFLILMKSTLLFLSWIVSLVLYLSCHHSQGHLGFLLCYLLGVL